MDKEALYIDESEVEEYKANGWTVKFYRETGYDGMREVYIASREIEKEDENK